MVEVKAFWDFAWIFIPLHYPTLSLGTMMPRKDWYTQSHTTCDKVQTITQVSWLSQWWGSTQFWTENGNDSYVEKATKSLCTFAFPIFREKEERLSLFLKLCPVTNNSKSPFLILGMSKTPQWEGGWLNMHREKWPSYSLCPYLKR
jgi:hypothetical protein